MSHHPDDSDGVFAGCLVIIAIVAVMLVVLACLLVYSATQ